MNFSDLGQLQTEEIKGPMSDLFFHVASTTSIAYMHTRWYIKHLNQFLISHIDEDR